MNLLLSLFSDILQSLVHGLRQGSKLYTGWSFESESEPSGAEVSVALDVLFLV